MGIRNISYRFYAAHVWKPFATVPEPQPNYQCTELHLEVQYSASPSHFLGSEESQLHYCTRVEGSKPSCQQRRRECLRRISSRFGYIFSRGSRCAIPALRRHRGRLDTQSSARVYCERSIDREDGHSKRMAALSGS